MNERARAELANAQSFDNLTPNVGRELLDAEVQFVIGKLSLRHARFDLQLPRPERGNVRSLSNMCAGRKLDALAVRRPDAVRNAQRTCFRSTETASRSAANVLRPATPLSADEPLGLALPSKAQFAYRFAVGSFEQVIHFADFVGLDQHRMLGDQASVTLDQRHGQLPEHSRAD